MQTNPVKPTQDIRPSLPANTTIKTDLTDIRTRADNLLREMTLAEKIGQMTQVEKNSLTPQDVEEYCIGSVLSGGGGNPSNNSAASWAEMVTSFQKAALKTRLRIPLIYGSDAVHGHSNVVGAVIFPHNVGLGATRDPRLLEHVGEITSTEILATSVHWTFAPAVTVPQDIRWGRTFEGFSENTELVSELGAAFMRGLQRPNHRLNPANPPRALPSVKHFLADGGTQWNRKRRFDWIPMFNFPETEERWGCDQGNVLVDEETLRRIHLPPYIAALNEGAMNIMVSYSSWQGLKLHAHRYLLTDVLKGELGFEGFLVADWMAMDQVDRDFYTATVNSINAGLDMIMVPFDFKRFINTLTEAVTKGDVPMSRIDDAVRRILLAKLSIGIFEDPIADPAWVNVVGAQEHRDIAREAVRKSQVLLKNDANVIPINGDITSVLVAGHAAEDIGYQCGGWTIDWAGRRGNHTPGTTLHQSLRQRLPSELEFAFNAEGNFGSSGTQADLGIVVIAEEPYVEGLGDQADLSLKPDQIALIDRMRAQVEKLVLIIYSGRPLVITEVVDKCDAIVAS